jgi:Flp pilus assembly protein TadG
MRSDRKAKERGTVLTVSAFGMLAFLLAVGLCVDISHLYVVKAELQNAADAAALAGASALNSSPAGITAAADRASEAMNNYEFNNTETEITPDDVKFSVNFDGPYVDAASAAGQAAQIRFVKVQVPSKAVGVVFSAQAIGSNKVNVSQQAIAGMSVPPNVLCEWIPLSVIDDDVADPFVPGKVYIIRGGPHGSVSPGNYQILAIAGRGGADAREGLAKGVNECAAPGAIYDKDTKPGVSAGPVRQGLNTRFDEYASGMDWTEYPPDTNIKEGITFSQYLAAQKGSSDWQDPAPGHVGVPMRRVVIIPLLKLSEYDPGRDDVKFYKFAAFFLQTKVSGGSGGDVVAEYIGQRIVFGMGGYLPGAGPVVPELANPVLYK